jgi:glycosyltransferase involved in cell wall biosynthesis
MDKSLVSIIIPTFNRAHLIIQTLESVKNQSYTNWECLIIDDNSTDKSIEVINDFIKEDLRFSVYIKQKKEKKGASTSRNIGINNSKGSYIQFLDSDDLLSQNKLEAQLELLDKENKYIIATCKWGLYEEGGPFNLYENNRDYKNFKTGKEYFDLIGNVGGFFPPHTFLVSRELIEFSGFWNEDLSMNDDGEFFFRVILNSKGIKFVNNTFVKYRVSSGDNLSTLDSLHKAESLIESWKLIESFYYKKYNDGFYIYNKKSSIYFGIKEKYPELIIINKIFFKKQIKSDNLFLKLNKLKKRIKMKLKIYYEKLL